MAEVTETKQTEATQSPDLTANKVIGQLYVARAKMSSPNFVIDSKELDMDIPADQRRRKEITFKFPKGLRKKIQAARVEFSYEWAHYTVRCYGLRICNEAGRELIEKAIAETETKMREIDPSLKAESVFFPLETKGIAKTVLYQQIVGAIQTQICETTLKKVNVIVERGKDKITTRTRNSLLKVMDQLKILNIVNDSNVDARIREIRERIETDSVIPLKEHLDEMLKTSTGRFGAIEF